MTHHRAFATIPFLSLFLSAAFTGPVAAQTAVEQFHANVVTDTVGAGFTEEEAESIAACFSERITEDEAQAVLDATELAEQQAVVAEMAQHDEALACTVAILQ